MDGRVGIRSEEARQGGHPALCRRPAPLQRRAMSPFSSPLHRRPNPDGTLGRNGTCVRFAERPPARAATVAGGAMQRY